MSGFNISGVVMGALSLVGATTIAREGLRYIQILNGDRLDALIALKDGLKESLANALEKEVYTPIAARRMKNDVTHWAMELDQFQKEFRRSSSLKAPGRFLKDRAVLQELEQRALNYSSDIEAATSDYLSTLPANLTAEQRIESTRWYHGVRNLFRGYQAVVANMPWFISVEASSDSDAPEGHGGTNVLPFHRADPEAERPEMSPGTQGQ